ncbi:hypothetical protein HPB52_007889 [Rhipicephalus sanguineus]|uniref:Uncharacterized protein n=1 Tax=Rhipicephalus sanguineus TaxID=34632 RepID=A0A9D4SW73_RHISA|nr:hypothetical protein HPB52_007889 [Rhipicephalus sanguineus]
MFTEDMSRLFRQADPEMPVAKKLGHLMKGVYEQLFAGLRHAPTNTVEFIKEAAAIQRTLQQRWRYHERPNNASISVCARSAGSEDSLRELIREVVRAIDPSLHSTTVDSTAYCAYGNVVALPSGYICYVVAKDVNQLTIRLLPALVMRARDGSEVREPSRQGLAKSRDLAHRRQGRLVKLWSLPPVSAAASASYHGSSLLKAD